MLQSICQFRHVHGTPETHDWRGFQGVDGQRVMLNTGVDIPVMILRFSPTYVTIRVTLKP